MNSLVSIQNLTVEYPIRGGFLGRRTGSVKAVNDVSFDINRGEILGLVGESGCGKSTLGKALIRLTEATSGSVIFDNEDILKLSKSEFRPMRKKIQMIFQDPYSSLNPRMRIEQILREPFIIHGIGSKESQNQEILKLLNTVGLREESLVKYPHEFSGGQRQRIGIARSLAVRPDFIVADEPVSALDVSIQSQILNLLRQLQAEFQLTYLFISHDLNVIRYLCDRIVVMYLGRVMEILTRDQLLDVNYPKHPYTMALIASAPRKHPREKRDASPLKGDIPSPARPPSGCVFHTRCPEVVPECKMQIPRLLKDSRDDHFVACHKRRIPDE